jgi:hypothetical protein
MPDQPDPAGALRDAIDRLHAARQHIAVLALDRTGPNTRLMADLRTQIDRCIARLEALEATVTPPDDDPYLDRAPGPEDAA